jgi:hypothetical protein
MAWSSLAANQIPTFTDLQTSGFTLNAGQSAVTSNECVTKANALAKYNLSSTAMNSFASNQLVPKSAYASGAVTSYSFSVKLGTTLSNVCTATPITIYSDIDTWGSGEMTLWLDAALTIGLSGYNYGVLSSETLIYGITSSVDYQYLDGSTYGNCSTLTDVVITACGTNPDGAGVVTLYAYASQAVDTSVSVQIRWDGDLFTQLTGTAIISSGQSIGSVTVSPTLTGENFGGLEILSITPTSSSTQNYIEGSTSGGTCAT